MERTWTDGEGRTWTVRSEEGKLVFLHGGRRRVATPERAGDLEALDDAELRTLFEAAPSEEAAAGSGPASPSAMGRESSPHVDLSKHGSNGSS